MVKPKYKPIPKSDHDKKIANCHDDQESEERKDESSETRLFGISLVLGIHFFSSAMAIPVLPSLLLQIFNDDHAETARCGGWLNSLKHLLCFLVMPLWGAASDVIGRKPVITIGIFASAFSWLLIGIMPTYSTLFIATVMSGSLISVVTTSFAGISDVTARVLRQRGTQKAQDITNRNNEDNRAVVAAELEEFVKNLEDRSFSSHPSDEVPEIGHRVVVRDQLEDGTHEVLHGMVVGVNPESNLPVVLVDGWRKSFTFFEWKVVDTDSYEVGDQLHVRDKTNCELGVWKQGTVSGIGNGGIPLVHVEGWDEGFHWDLYKRCLSNDIRDLNNKQSVEGASTKTSKQLEDGEKELGLLTSNYAIVGCIWGISVVIGPLIGGAIIAYFGDARYACLVIAFSDSTAFIVAQCCLKETIAKKESKLKCSHANPFPPLMVFFSSPELIALLIPLVLSVGACGVHSIMYLYFVIKFGWTPVKIGLFFSCVGLVTALTQGVIIPRLVPNCISVRFALPLGLAFHALEYVLYSLCQQGWQLVACYTLTCLSGLEPPTLHALISSQVPPSRQGVLHGALSAVRTLVAVVAVPCFSILFAWSIGERNDRSIKGLTETVTTSGGVDTEEQGLSDSGDIGEFQQEGADINLAEGLFNYFTNSSSLSTNILDMFSNEESQVESSGDRRMDHLAVPFYTAAALFFVSSVTAICVLKAFPTMGKEGMKPEPTIKK